MRGHTQVVEICHRRFAPLLRGRRESSAVSTSYQSLHMVPELHNALEGESKLPELQPNELMDQERKCRNLVAAGMVIPLMETHKSWHNERGPFHHPFDSEGCIRKGTQVHDSLKYNHD
jgi:hypothetical protein